jgi:hypothetical protein
MGADRGMHRVLVGKTEGKRPLGRPRLDGRIILRWMFRKLDGVVGTGWSCLRIGQVAGTCEYGKETSGSIKCGEFLG